MTGLTPGWVIFSITVGEKVNNNAATIIVTPTPTATLPAALFFAVGAATKLFWTPHIGQADRNDPYRLPHAEQSIEESSV
jgi:hypothetical protein